MPIVSPNLDDLTYDRIVTELTRRIPVYSPEWTDYNDSDPGITLIQLFAYLTEMVGYRLNQVPQKSQASLMQLLGVTLNPATPASTQLALLLTDPTKVTAYTLAKGASFAASTGSPPPAFETSQGARIVPVEPVVMVTTHQRDIRQPWSNEERREDHNLTDFLTIVWDGQTPTLKDMPLTPVSVAPQPHQRHLWIGLSLNADASAGALGADVQMTFQFDADDQASPGGAAKSGARVAAAQQAKPVEWLWYYDAAEKAVLRVPGRIDDTTNQLANSGTVAFSIPSAIGPIPASEFQPIIKPNNLPPGAFYAEQVAAATTALGPAPTTAGTFGSVAAAQAAWANTYQMTATEALNNAIATLRDAAPPVANPLDPKYYATAAWICIDLATGANASPSSKTKLRIATFNAAPAVNATTVTNEIIGVANGRPGQAYQLAHGNIQPTTLSLAVQESPAGSNAPLTPWTWVASLDPSGPFDRVFELDSEAGTITFGDGIHGRIPPLTPQGGAIIALSYVWGGGSAGNLPVGAITVLNSSAPGVGAAVNYVPAAGGVDPETQPQAQARTSKLLSTGSRAVATGDFAWMAMQTPGVQVAKAVVVPLRKPASDGTGLEDSDTPGVVTVIAVPQDTGAEPTPTAAFLNTVAQSLDSQRLITTEVYVAPPQYIRLLNVKVSVAGLPGYTRAQLQSAVSAQLAGYLNVLTGGADGGGFPFGGELRVSDLASKIYQVAGIARVDSVTADFTRTRSAANPRQGSLAQAPAASSTSQFSSLTLAQEESVSFDANSFLLSTVG
jgi:predicted phage baseplate assembly protein